MASCFGNYRHYQPPCHKGARARGVRRQLCFKPMPSLGLWARHRDMLIAVPVFTAVYTRCRASDQTFRFSHLSRASYLRPVPTTLAVSDLRQYSVDTHNVPPGAGVSDVPLFAFVTGDPDDAAATVIILTLRNWAHRAPRVLPYTDRFTPVLSPTSLHPDPRCTETVRGYIMIPFFAALCSYVQQGRHARWGFSGQRFIPCSHSILPPTLDPTGRRVAPYVAMCRRALRRAAHTHTWLVGRYSYQESAGVPRGCRHDT